ncbi:MAG: PH domain-containing protein [Roseateles asaccharophilus]|jgi:hypothetical protein|uniref:PH domain-containing protein n=1 Tax=Roseateles asaccharophilus TaxID=582607 RepID=UPI00391AE4DA
MLFRSKIDAWLLIVLLGAAILTVVAAGAAVRQASGMAVLVPVLVIAIGAALPIWILASTSYTVDGGTLNVRSGPFTWRIPVSSITSIKPSNSPSSGPALSLSRLRVEYGRGKSILISPADQQAFLRAIESAKSAASQVAGAEPLI